MKKRKRWGNLLTILVGVMVGLVLAPTQSKAFIDFTKVIGFDADAMARGGTSIAIPDEPSNMNFNPALISGINGNSLEANLVLIHPDMYFKYSGTGGQRYTSKDKDRLLLGPGISFAHHGKGSPFSWGLTLAAPDALATDYTVQSKYYGPVNGFSELMHLRFGPAFAYQLTPDISIGVRLGIDYHSLDLRAPLGLAYLDIGQCDGYGFSGAIGIFYKPSDSFSLGLYYETPAFMQDLESQHADGYLKVLNPPPVGQVDFSRIRVKVKDMDFPQNFGLGVAFKPLPSLRLSADVKYINWDKDWDEMELNFKGSGGAAMRAAGVPTTLKVPLHIDDQVTFGIGAEYFCGGIYKLAVGYHYNDDAMSDNYLLPYIPAEVEHTITCGLSVMPTNNIKMGAAYLYCIMDDPSASSHHGYDQVLEEQLGLPPGALSSELNNAKVDYSAHIVQLSISIRW